MGYRCNNNCKFCVSANKKNFTEKSTKQIVDDLINASYRRGLAYLEITGGEPTIRDDFINLVKIAKSLGYKRIFVSSNGRMLMYKDYAKALIESGINGIILSIHGHKAELHDSLTMVNGSFNELLKGIENLKSFGFNKIGSNTTIVKQNYRYLPEIGKFIYQLGIRNSEFIFVDPTFGGARENFDSLVPRISKAAPYIRKCLDIGKNNKVRIWNVRYVPFCYFVGYEHQISELSERRIFLTEHLAPDFKNFDVSESRQRIGRVKLKRCKRCCYFDYCEGIWKVYLAKYGDKELVPKKLSSVNKNSYVVKIGIDKINPFAVHRKNIDEEHLQKISVLKRKILKREKIYPLNVKFNKKNNTFDLLDGFCRYKAFDECGVKKVPCLLT